MRFEFRICFEFRDSNFGFMKLKTFQIVIIAVFIFFIVFAVLLFSGLLPFGEADRGQSELEAVVTWGTISDSDMDQVLALAGQQGHGQAEGTGTREEHDRDFLLRQRGHGGGQFRKSKESRGGEQTGCGLLDLQPPTEGGEGMVVRGRHPGADDRQVAPRGKSGNGV